MKRLVLVMGMALTLPSALADDVYRWVDKEGKVHYGGSPVEGAEKLKISAPETEAASGVEDTKVPYEARMASKKFPVTLYVMDKCGDPCQQARNYLAKRRVPYATNTIKTEEELAAFKQKSGTDAVPTLSVGHSWIKGFQAEQWADELDAAGYPK